jgi:hypothetical protein
MLKIRYFHKIAFSVLLVIFAFSYSEVTHAERSFAQQIATPAYFTDQTGESTSLHCEIRNQSSVEQNIQVFAVYSNNEPRTTRSHGIGHLTEIESLAKGFKLGTLQTDRTLKLMFNLDKGDTRRTDNSQSNNSFINTDIKVLKFKVTEDRGAISATCWLWRSSKEMFFIQINAGRPF